MNWFQNAYPSTKKLNIWDGLHGGGVCVCVCVCVWGGGGGGGIMSNLF